MKQTYKALKVRSSSPNSYVSSLLQVRELTNLTLLIPWELGDLNLGTNNLPVYHLLTKVKYLMFFMLLSNAKNETNVRDNSEN